MQENCVGEDLQGTVVCYFQYSGKYCKILGSFFFPTIRRDISVAFVGVATWFRNGTATNPPAARAISSQTPMWWTANGVY